MTRYQLALLLLPYDEADIVYTTTSYVDCMNKLKWYKLHYPKEYYVWREIDG